MPADNYGSGRLRFCVLPNGQFFVVLDRTGFIGGDERASADWREGRDVLLSRLGPECAGVLRFARDLSLPQDQKVHLGGDGEVVAAGGGGAHDDVGAGREWDPGEANVLGGAHRGHDDAAL